MADPEEIRREYVEFLTKEAQLRLQYFMGVVLSKQQAAIASFQVRVES
jgi:hypothetical protein